MLWDKCKYNFPKSMGCIKSSSEREVHSETGSPQETRKILKTNLTLLLKKLEKEEQSPKLVEENKKDEGRNKWNRK